METAAFLQRVGQRLGIVPAAGTLSAEDSVLIEGAYVSLGAELAEHNLMPFYHPDHVHDPYVEVLSGMVAALLVDDFGVAEPRRSMILTTHAFGMPVATPSERRLRAMLRIESNDDSEPEFY
jgi:hypothetical protein